MIDQLLEKSIKRQVKQDSVAVLLSGGMDSFSVAVSAHRIGKTVRAYTFQLKDRPNPDSVAAQRISETFGWPIIVCEIPHQYKWGGVSFPDFHHLCLFVGCRRKVEFEVCYPFLWMFDALQDETFILSGWGADGYYGLSRRATDPSKGFDVKNSLEGLNRFRKSYFSKNPACYNQISLMMRQRGKHFIAPYVTDSGIADYFAPKTWQDLNDTVQTGGSKQKGLTRLAYKTEIDQVGRLAPQNNLQKNGISDIFADMLKDPRYNITNRTRWMDLARDWSRMSVEQIREHRKKMRDEQWNDYGETENYWVPRLKINKRV